MQKKLINLIKDKYNSKEFIYYEHKIYMLCVQCSLTDKAVDRREKLNGLRYVGSIYIQLSSLIGPFAVYSGGQIQGITSGGLIRKLDGGTDRFETHLRPRNRKEQFQNKGKLTEISKDRCIIKCGSYYVMYRTLRYLAP